MEPLSPAPAPLPAKNPFALAALLGAQESVAPLPAPVLPAPAKKRAPSLDLLQTAAAAAPLPVGMVAPLPAGLAVRRGSLGRAPPLPEASVAAGGRGAPPALGTAGNPSHATPEFGNQSALGSPRAPSALPVVGSRYVVVRKGQQFRAEANPKSRKMGKMRLGEELVVQDVQMLEGIGMRVLCARPVQMSANATQSLALAAGWCSIMLKGRTQLAPVGVEEVQVYDDGEDEEDDGDAASGGGGGGELIAGLIIEGEFGFGLDIGEAVVAGEGEGEEAAAAAAAMMTRTVVTNVDVGCQAEGLGVTIGMELIRIGGEDVSGYGEDAVDRVYAICDEQAALGVGVPGGDPLEWVFKLPSSSDSNTSTAGQGQGTPRTKLMLRQYEVIKVANVRRKIQVIAIFKKCRKNGELPLKNDDFVEKMADCFAIRGKQQGIGTAAGRSGCGGTGYIRV